MNLDTARNTINLKYDARNKEPKSFQFDQVEDGVTDQRSFFRSTGVKGMIK